jgi:hypothetical protein
MKYGNGACISLINHFAMKTYRKMEEQLHAFITSMQDGGQKLGSAPGELTSVPIRYK